LLNPAAVLGSKVERRPQSAGPNTSRGSPPCERIARRKARKTAWFSTVRCTARDPSSAVLRSEPLEGA